MSLAAQRFLRPSRLPFRHFGPRLRPATAYRVAARRASARTRAGSRGLGAVATRRAGHVYSPQREVRTAPRAWEAGYR